MTTTAVQQAPCRQHRTGTARSGRGLSHSLTIAGRNLVQVMRTH
jgi:hypothetical protein